MEALRQVWAFITAIVEWLNLHKFDFLAPACAIGAAVATAHVMRRLDEGRVRGLGIWFTGLALLFVVTIVSVRAVVAGTPAAPNAPYRVALLVLLIAAVIWWSARRYESAAPASSARAPRSPRPAHASSAIVVLIACAALIAVLWIIDASIALNEAAGGPLRNLALLPASSAEFLAQAAAAGLLAMATIQGVRTIVPVRGVFHRAALIRWIDESVKSAATTPKDETSKPPETMAPEPAQSAAGVDGASTPTATDATASNTKTGTSAEDTMAPADDPSALLMEMAQMASPASGAHHYALFDLPIEQLCGQLAAGADRLLDNVVPVSSVKMAPPKEPPMVKIGVAMGTPQVVAKQSDEAKGQDVAAMKMPIDAASLLRVMSASRKDIDQFLGRANAQAATTQTPAAAGFGSATSAANPPDLKEGRDRLRLRAAISQRIQQNIDRLQIDATFWWKRLLRGVAVTICGVLGLTLLDGHVSAVVFAIVGGFVATVARDLVAIVEKVRR